MNDEYQDALDYRKLVESGDINKGDFVLGSKYLALLNDVERIMASHFRVSVANAGDILKLEQQLRELNEYIKNYLK